MPSANQTDEINVLLEALRQVGGDDLYQDAVEMGNRMDAHVEAYPDASPISILQAANLSLWGQMHLGLPKWAIAHGMLRDSPSKWFRDLQVDDRDLALINAGPLPGVNLGKLSFLKHHNLKDMPFETTRWTVQNDKKLHGMLAEFGAGFSGFTQPLVHLPARNWEHMRVNVNIDGDVAPGIAWVFFPHPGDIMILRDFRTNIHTNSSGLDAVEHVMSCQYDILLMNAGQDTDYPWIVLAVKDSGPLEMPS